MIFSRQAINIILYREAYIFEPFWFLFIFVIFHNFWGRVSLLAKILFSLNFIIKTRNQSFYNSLRGKIPDFENELWKVFQKITFRWKQNLNVSDLQNRQLAPTAPYYSLELNEKALRLTFRPRRVCLRSDNVFCIRDLSLLLGSRRGKYLPLGICVAVTMSRFWTK